MLNVAFLLRPKKCEIPCRSSDVTFARQMQEGSRGSGSHRGMLVTELDEVEGAGDTRGHLVAAMLKVSYDGEREG
jgi:hypothetical protein